VNVRIVEGLDGVNALRTAWEGLESSAVSPMQQFIWTQACASTLTRESELRIVVLEDAGKPIAFAPLIQRQGKPFLEILGMAELYEPTDFIYSHSDALIPLARELADLGIPLHLRRIPAESPMPDALKKGFRGKGPLFRRVDNSWPWIPLHAGWAEPETQLNSKRRSHLHRIRRIASEFGTVTSEVLTPEPTNLNRLIDEAFAIEAAGWKGETGTALAKDAFRGAFFRRYAAAACEKGILRLSFLRINGQAVAMQMGVESCGGIWLLKIGYDDRFARCSPGNLLVRETLHYAAMRGLKALHFLGVVEHWTQQWTEDEKACVVIRAYPLGFRGATVLASDIVKSAWQKLGHHKSAKE
jgi:CelD/BcsL family acetyltransferase involved in cellulose biosynthesis